MTKTIKVMISIIGLVVLLVIGWQIVNQTLSAESISEQDVREKLQSQYKGEVTDLQSIDDHYIAEVALEKGVYEVVVMKEDGRIADMRMVVDFLTNEEDEGAENEEGSPDSSQKEENPQPITEKQARETALKEVGGQVDDIDFESKSTGSYYLVDIERGDETEATIQVNAITGEIMSVSWDD